MNKDEALRLALVALEHGGCPPDCKDGMTDSGGVHPWGEAALIPCPNCKAITAIKQALEQPEPEPVAYQDIAEKCRLETVPAKGTLLHTSPPASKSWQGLTGEGIDKLADMHRKE